MRALRQLHHGLLLRAVGAVVILLVFLNVWLWHSRSSSTSVLSDDVPPDQKEDQLCAEFTGSDRVLVTVKTGATEANLKIPIQLSTSLRCAPNVLIFSDMVQEIGDHHVYDALENIPDEVTANNSDFDIYRMQQELKDPQKVIEQLSSMRDPRMPEDLAAWTLDKYKNIHIVEEAWKLQPNKDWYFHIDADTYVVWPTLLQWIQKLDPSMESFIGSMAYVIGLPFAHGGSGMLMSRAVVQNLVVKHNGTAAKWDYSMHENCCGDWVLAQALKEYGIDVKNAWPVINGETASTIPFAEDHWCQPLVTMHHLTPLDFEQLGRFELQRPNKADPLTYAELFKGLVSDQIQDQQEDWDNLASDKAISDVGSAEDCRKACDNDKQCFQSVFDGVECNLGTENFRIGGRRNATSDNRWYSSWNKTRIAAWVSKQKPCGKIHYPFRKWW